MHVGSGFLAFVTPIGLAMISRVSTALLFGAVWCAVGCSTDEPEKVKEKFVEDTDDGPIYNTTSTSTSFPVDTGFGSVPDVDPDHFLHISQLGTWTMSPPGGPYDNMTGGLIINEIIDDGPEDTAEPPECEVTYTLVGQTYAPNSCADCDWTLTVEFTGDGDRDSCHDPDMPPLNTEPGGGWPMGYSSSTNKVYFNYFGTGVWVPWYNAVKVGDVITIDFLTSVAIEVEEEEE